MLGSVTYFPAERRRGREIPEGWIVRIGDKQVLRGSFSAAVRMALRELLSRDEAEAIMSPGGPAVSQPESPPVRMSYYHHHDGPSQTSAPAISVVTSGT
jgi:hypothetical protein